MIDLSPLRKDFDGKPLVLLGMGKSATAVFQAARKAGIDVYLWDDNEAQRTAAESAGIKVHEPTVEDLKNAAALCMAPGVPLTHPKPHAVAMRAQEAGIDILGDIELFHRAKPKNKTIGITGTNGKSTTTALTGHIFKTARVESAVGGNIGEAVMTLPDLGDDATYILELSSYQLDLMTTFYPNIAAHINFSPDHLDRHGDMNGYINAKERIFRGPGVAVLGVDDDHSQKLCERVKKAGERKIVPVSTQRPLNNGVFVSKEGMLFDGKEAITNLSSCPALKGQHNWQNAGIAYAIAREAGIERGAIERGIQSFPGLAHRQHIVATINGVTYINDSKATNDEAAAMALKTYGRIYWIAGGKPKDGGYKACQQYLSHVCHAFLIGQAEEEMAQWLEKNKIEVSRCGNLATATVAAHQLAQKEKLDKAVVLLSPACASFDQFKSFEHRGEVFTDLVTNLKNGKKKDKPA